MNVKRELCVLAIFSTVVSTFAVSPTFDLTGVVLFPKEDEFFESAFGGEAKFTYWATRNIGLTAATGYQYWKLEDQYGYYRSRYLNINALTSGDAGALLIGPSVQVKLDADEKLDFIVELGLRYAAIQSDVTYSEVAADRRGYHYYSANVDIDNTVVAVLGASLKVNLSKTVAITVGGGYQPCLRKPEATIDGEELGEIDINAAFARAGLVFTI